MCSRGSCHDYESPCHGSWSSCHNSGSSCHYAILRRPVQKYTYVQPCCPPVQPHCPPVQRYCPPAPYCPQYTKTICKLPPACLKY
ncbi:putative small proline-rich protein 5 [Caloenas nicobarica]|uniref:putative small proline-rich protein 5 n=1 Tax=Caloenas nicobarica TaxID=187106 RepID=UPI0032B87D8C